MKIGKWTEILDDFDKDFQMVYIGEYNNGKKVGRWDIRDIEKCQKNFIGGGSYDDDGVGIKIGKWIELINSQIALQGDYENGKKIGRWNIIELPDGKIQNELGSYYGKDEIK